MEGAEKSARLRHNHLTKPLYFFPLLFCCFWDSCLCCFPTAFEGNVTAHPHDFSSWLSVLLCRVRSALGGAMLLSHIRAEPLCGAGPGRAHEPNVPLPRLCLPSLIQSIPLHPSVWSRNKATDSTGCHWLNWVQRGLITLYTGLWNLQWSKVRRCELSCTVWGNKESSYGSEPQVLCNCEKGLRDQALFFFKLSANGSIVSCKGFCCSCNSMCDICSTLCSMSKVIWDSLLSFGDFAARCLTSMWLDPGKISQNSVQA